MSEAFDDQLIEYPPLEPERVKEVAQAALGKTVHWTEASGEIYYGISLGAQHMPPLVSMEVLNENGSVSIHNIPANSIRSIKQMGK